MTVMKKNIFLLVVTLLLLGSQVAVTKIQSLLFLLM